MDLISCHTLQRPPEFQWKHKLKGRHRQTQYTGSSIRPAELFEDSENIFWQSRYSTVCWVSEWFFFLNKMLPDKKYVYMCIRMFPTTWQHTLAYWISKLTFDQEEGAQLQNSSAASAKPITWKRKKNKQKNKFGWKTICKTKQKY